MVKHYRVLRAVHADARQKRHLYKHVARYLHHTAIRCYAATFADDDNNDDDDKDDGDDDDDVFTAATHDRYLPDSQLLQRLHHRIHHGNHLYTDVGLVDSDSVLQVSTKTGSDIFPLYTLPPDIPPPRKHVTNDAYILGGPTKVKPTYIFVCKI